MNFRAHQGLAFYFHELYSLNSISGFGYERMFHRLVLDAVFSVDRKGIIAALGFWLTENKTAMALITGQLCGIRA